MMNLKKISLLFSLLTAAISTLSQANTLPTAQAQFVRQLAIHTHIPTTYTETVLKHTRYLPAVITKITAPYEAEPFDVYLKYFLTENRIYAGTIFFKTHRQVLLLAEKKYGVSPEAITAILGIETFYGTRQGNFSVLNALYTLAFYYPPRAAFFKKELAAYLTMCYLQHRSPYQIKGSYAGAFGMPQFMPSSYQKFAVAFNPQHAPDLIHNPNDAIMSIAFYLQKAGWQAQQPIASKFTVTHTIMAQLPLSPHATPTTTVGALKKIGIHPNGHFSNAQKASIVFLPDRHSREYWIAFPNLKSIMRYNTSINYAMTAYLLSEAIKSHLTIYDKRP